MGSKNDLNFIAFYDEVRAYVEVHRHYDLLQLHTLAQVVRKYSVYFDMLNINSDRWNCFRGSKEIRNLGILKFFTGVNNDKQVKGAITYGSWFTSG